jgi:hypothetical protein
MFVSQSVCLSVFLAEAALEKAEMTNVVRNKASLAEAALEKADI